MSHVIERSAAWLTLKWIRGFFNSLFFLILADPLYFCGLNGLSVWIQEQADTPTLADSNIPTRWDCAKFATETFVICEFAKKLSKFFKIVYLITLGFRLAM